jgi:hypothetical protein
MDPVVSNENTISFTPAEILDAAASAGFGFLLGEASLFFSSSFGF